MRNKRKELLNLYSKRKIASNKGRSTFVRLIVLLTTVLLVAFYFVSINTLIAFKDTQFLEGSGIKMSGYLSVEESEYSDAYDYLDDNNKVSAITYELAKTNDLFSIVIEGFEGNNFEISVVEDTLFDYQVNYISEGRLPVSSNEIMVAEIPTVQESIIDDKITLEFKVDNEVVSKTFDVVGYYDDRLPNNYYQFIVSKDFYIENNIDYVYKLYFYGDSFSKIDDVYEFGNASGFEFVVAPVTALNFTLVSVVMYLVLSVFTFLIIKNVCSIYYTQDKEEILLLKNLGFTKKDLKKFIFNYYCRLAIIPTILGVAVSYIINYIVNEKVLTFVTLDKENTFFDFAVYLLSIVVIVLIFFLISLGLFKDKQQKIKVRKRNLAANKGFISNYVKRSISINRIKYTLIAVSLGLSLSMLIVSISFSIIVDPVKTAQSSSIYDITVTSNEDAIGGTPGLFSEFQAPEGTDFYSTYGIYAVEESNDLLSPYVAGNISIDLTATQYFNPDSYSNGILVNTTDGLSIDRISLVGIDSTFFDSLESTGYNVSGDYSNGKVTYFRPFGVEDNVNLGDNINITIFDDFTIELTIGSIAELDQLINYNDYSGVIGFTDEDFKNYFDKSNLPSEHFVGYKLIGLNAPIDDIETLTSEIAQNNTSLNVSSSLDYIRKIEKQKFTVILFGAGSSIFFLVIALLNIYGIQESICRTRSKEISTLEAIGGSKKDCLNLIRKEGYYYLRNAVVISSIISVVSIIFIESKIFVIDSWIVVSLLVIFLLNLFIIIIANIFTRVIYNRFENTPLAMRANDEL